MTTVLIVDDDDVLRGALAQELRARAYQVHEASDADQAIDLLQAHRPEVLLTDLRLKGRDGIDLLAQMRGVSPGTLAVLMSGFATAKDYKTALDLGAVTVLTKPFTPRDVLEAVEHASDCATGFRGSVHGLSLVDMLQMFHFGKRTIALQIGGARGGLIEFEAGEIVHAELGAERGVPALQAILRMPTGAMRTTVPDGDLQRTIATPFQSLLMDCVRVLDEQGKRADTLPLPDDLDASFKTWNSIPPSSPPAADEPDARYVALAGALERVAPQLGVGVVFESTDAVLPIRNFFEGKLTPGALRALRAAIDQALPGDSCRSFEFVSDRVAFSLVFDTDRDQVLFVDVTMIDPLSAQRFRSQMRQVLSFLGAT